MASRSVPHKLDDSPDKRGGGNAIAPAHGGRIGNPPHEWSKEIAHKVEIMSAQGVSQDVIAFACDVSVETVRKYYRDELDRGGVRANTRVFAAILTTAEGERVPCIGCEDHPGKTKDGKLCKDCHGTAFVWRREPNTTAQVWWSKNKMGWTDRERIEHVGDGGGPIVHEQRNSGDMIKQRLTAIKKRIANDDKGESASA